MRYLILLITLLNLSVVEARQATSMTAKWKEVLEDLPDYPEERFEGQGIVIPAGGEFYLINAYVNLSALRYHGCQLPVEIWYIGEKEYVPHMMEKLEALGAKCCDITKVFNYPIKGFEVKAHALLASSFQEVMLLDADNVPLSDPEYLFFDSGYLKTGTLFWPDISLLEKDNPLWDVLELEPRRIRAQESGQVIMDKKKCWKALNLCVHMNKESDFYYRCVYGDKDTFFLSCLATKKSYSMIKHLPGLVFRVAGDNIFSSFLQRDYYGEPLFCHTVVQNWSERPNFDTMWHYYSLPSQSSDELSPPYPFRTNQFTSFKGRYKGFESKCIGFFKEIVGCEE